MAAPYGSITFPQRGSCFLERNKIVLKHYCVTLIDGQNEIEREKLSEVQELLFNISFVMWQKEQLGAGNLLFVNGKVTGGQKEPHQESALLFQKPLVKGDWASTSDLTYASQEASQIFLRSSNTSQQGGHCPFFLLHPVVLIGLNFKFGKCRRYIPAETNGLAWETQTAKTLLKI